MTQGCPPTRRGLDRSCRRTPSRLATGFAVSPYTETVATITRNVTGRILAAPPTPLLTRPVVKVVAVAAATIPRGAIHPTNLRSPVSRSVCRVEKSAASGRAITISTATRPRVGSIRPFSDAGVMYPLVRVTFDWPDNEIRMCAYMAAKIAAIAHASDATIIGKVNALTRPFDIRFYQSTHVTGGTIMGADPNTSVVSPHLQHWDAHNLFVVGASVYPHNSSFNPTGPLAALALRLGDDLIRYVRNPGFLPL